MAKRGHQRSPPSVVAGGQPLMAVAHVQRWWSVAVTGCFLHGGLLVRSSFVRKWSCFNLSL